VVDVLIVLAVGGNMMRRIEVLISHRVFLKSFAKVTSPKNPSTYP